MARPTGGPSRGKARKKADARRTTSLVAETAASSGATPVPTVPAVVFHSGARFVLRGDFAESAGYQAHRRRMEALTSFEHVLTALERMSKQLQRASRVDNTGFLDEKQEGLRSEIKGSMLYRRLCVAYDLHFRVPYAQRFLNTLARYNASSKNWRDLASRGMRVVDGLLYRSDWQGPGRRTTQRSRPSKKEIDALRSELYQLIQPIWRRYKREDVFEREDALKRVLDDFKRVSVLVPRKVLSRPPSRVIEFILSQHFGVWQVDTRPTSDPNIELYYR